MSQYGIILPTTGTVSGLQVVQDMNEALDTLNTLWSGNSAPSAPEPYQLWADTGNGILKQRNAANSAWVSLWKFGVSRHSSLMVGSVLQIAESFDGTFASTTNTIPFDNTIPQNTEGAEFTQAEVSFTPLSATSQLIIEAFGWFSVDTGGGNPVLALFKDSGASALAVGMSPTPGSANYNTSVDLTYKEASGSVTARTYKMRYGSSVGTTYINGNASGGALFGGAMRSGIRVTEIEL